MDFLLGTGTVILTGFLFGELAKLIKLPKVSGYIVAGIFLNPGLTHFITQDFIDGTSPLINIALAFITFSIGGTLSMSRIKASGKMILLLTLFEAIFAYLFVAVVCFVVIYYVLGIINSWSMALLVSLILASLASPTDPSATLAVKNEYHARGIVSTIILGIAAFDDITGIILYTFSLSFAETMIGNLHSGTFGTLLELGRNIGGALVLGAFTGFIFNFATKIFKRDSEGELIVTITGFLILAYGLATVLEFDALITTMTMGVIVVNFNYQQEKIFTIIERYTDELIFVIFFTLSGLHLQLSSLSGSAMLILVFVIARFSGKFTGIYTASVLTKAPSNVRKYTAGGLFPQGGIVIGLALLVAKNKDFHEFSTLIIGTVIGAAVIHELLGPVIAKSFLKKAGEIL